MNVFVVFDEYETEVAGVYTNYTEADIIREATMIIKECVEDKWDDTFNPDAILIKPFTTKSGMRMYYKDNGNMIWMVTITEERIIDGED